MLENLGFSMNIKHWVVYTYLYGKQLYYFWSKFDKIDHSVVAQARLAESSRWVPYTHHSLPELHQAEPTPLYTKEENHNKTYLLAP